MHLLSTLIGASLLWIPPCTILQSHKLLQDQHKAVCHFINNTLKLTEKAEAELNALTATTQVDEAKTELLALIDQTCEDEDDDNTDFQMGKR